MWNPIVKCFKSVALVRRDRNLQPALHINYGCQIGNSQHSVWLEKTTARILAAKFAGKNPHIRAVAHSPLHDAISCAHVEHPDHVIAIWNGVQYELHGVDAILCVEHCGIQPTGLSPHVEIAADEFVKVAKQLKQNGINVAVYKFVCALDTEKDHQSPVQKSSLVFSHFVPDTIEEQPRVSHHVDGLAAGVTYNKHGYSISVVNAGESSIEIRERLTLTSAVELLQSLDIRAVLFQNGNIQVKRLLALIPGVIHYEPLQGRFSSQGFHQAVCANIETRLNVTKRFNVKDLTGSRKGFCTLDKETALAFGLASDICEGPSKIKPLHLQMLPDECHYYLKQYMRYLLTRVMPKDVADDIRYINSRLEQLSISVRETKPMSASKVRTLGSSHQIDRGYLTELRETLSAFKYYLDELPMPMAKKLYAVALSDLGIHFRMDNSKKDVNRCLELIDSIVDTSDTEAKPFDTGIHCIDKLFKQSESKFSFLRQNVILSHREKVDSAATELLKTLVSDYLCLPKETSEKVGSESSRENISHILSNLSQEKEKCSQRIILTELYLLTRNINDVSDHTKIRTVETIIGNERTMAYYSEDVGKALLNYRNQCLLAEAKANFMLSQLRNSLAPYIQSILLMSHFLVVFQTLTAHVGMALGKGWTMPTVAEVQEISLRDAVPQHIDADEVYPISAKIRGVHVLAGPSNSGRSTIMTQVMSSCMAAVRGLYVPCASGSRVPWFEQFIYHSPAYGKDTDPCSDFSYSMKTLEHILATGSTKTLVVIDDLGSNLETMDGTAFTGCFIRKLIEKKSTAIVATNMAAIRRDCSSGTQFNMPEKVNGKMELVEDTLMRVPLSSLLPGSRLLESLQKEIDQYIKEDCRVTETMPSLETVANSKTQQDDRNYDWVSSAIDRFPSHLKEAAVAVTDAIKDIWPTIAKNSFVCILENGYPPPMLNNVPAVYLLLIPIVETKRVHDSIVPGRIQREYAGEHYHLGVNGHKNGTGELLSQHVLPAVYVGETGNLAARLKIHRAKKPTTVDDYFTQTYMNHESEMTEYLASKNARAPESPPGALDWKSSNAIVLKMPSRMNARIFERKLIKRLYRDQDRIVLLTHRDGTHREIAPVD